MSFSLCFKTIVLICEIPSALLKCYEMGWKLLSLIIVASNYIKAVVCLIYDQASVKSSHGLPPLWHLNKNHGLLFNIQVKVQTGGVVLGSLFLGDLKDKGTLSGQVSDLAII